MGPQDQEERKKKHLSRGLVVFKVPAILARVHRRQIQLRAKHKQELKRQWRKVRDLNGAFKGSRVKRGVKRQMKEAGNGIETKEGSEWRDRVRLGWQVRQNKISDRSRTGREICFGLGDNRCSKDVSLSDSASNFITLRPFVRLISSRGY